MKARSPTLLFILLTSACGNDKLNALPAPPAEPEAVPNVPQTCQTGGLHGSLCEPGTTLPQSDATLSLQAADCNGHVDTYSTTADADGHFAFSNLPAGTFTIDVDSNGNHSSFTATVVAGEINNLDADAATGDASAPFCLAAPPRLAVITGDWDEVQVLLDSLGLAYDTYEGEPDWANPESESEAMGLLLNPSKMAEYDAILINCGTLDRDFISATVDYGDWGDDPVATIDYNAPAYKNLRDFVKNGGSVYASDWAWPIAEGLSANAIDFHGDETNNAYNVLVGAEGGETADVTDAGLQSFLNADTVQLDFDLDSWAVIDDVGAGVDVYVRGDATFYLDMWGDETDTLTSRPLLVGFRPFTSGGYVIYTTFHYHAQPSAEMVDVLKYLIFQL